MKAATTALLFALGTLTGHAHADDLAALIDDCESCHGPAGVSQHADVPTIAGQDAEYLAKNLRMFKRWGRPCIKSEYRHGDVDRPRTDMCKIAEGLSNDEIEALSEHFSAQAFVAAGQEFDPELAARGASLHEEYCENCHHEGGKEAGRAPRLAGQWMDYLKKSLGFVPTGEHLVPPLMEKRVTDFGDAEIDALLHFYASQQD